MHSDHHVVVEANVELEFYKFLLSAVEKKKLNHRWVGEIKRSRIPTQLVADLKKSGNLLYSAYDDKGKVYTALVFEMAHANQKVLIGLSTYPYMQGGSELGDPFEVFIYSTSELGNKKILPKLMKKYSFGVAEVAEEENNINLYFWNMSTQGRGIYRERRVTVPSWKTIKNNYPTKVRNSISTLIDEGKDAQSGIILWTGQPGTGKTTAVRALIKEWEARRTPSLIMDPESFLNQPSYLNDILLEDTEDDRPLLLILEDSGELVSADAKAQTGQALSRLLNITDGLLGQGRSLITLITTNEDISDLHPAIRRSGRCINETFFDFFSVEDANKWFKSNKRSDIKTTKSLGLSDMYALINGKDPFEVEKSSHYRQRVGFSNE